MSFRDLGRLRNDGQRLSVAVNIAASSLSDPEFPRSGRPPDWRVRRRPSGSHPRGDRDDDDDRLGARRLVLNSLDEIGVTLSIDDFGTGYSSLSYLSGLPIDEVKIDRSFVMDMAVDERQAKIVTSTAGLVHSLGMRVVAEGVENRGRGICCALLSVTSLRATSLPNQWASPTSRRGSLRAGSFRATRALVFRPDLVGTSPIGPFWDGPLFSG